ncbi:hypothetical protein CEUSTIGMA_g7533.t1, partial [Chlamydomonas eustigma]
PHLLPPPPPPPSPPPPSPPPPPPPSPSPPPPPPPFEDFPHACYPGNSQANGGVGTGTGTTGFAKSVQAVATNNTLTFLISPNAACDMSRGCCTSNLEKIEIAINPLCRGAITSSIGASLEPSYATQTWPSTPPPGYTSGQMLLVAKVTGLCPGFPQNCSQSNAVTITLDPNNLSCNTVSGFLLNGLLWFADYGQTPTSTNLCCGTDTYSI